MAAIIVQLKRLREAKRGPGKKDAKRGPQIVPLPNAGDVVLDASAYDEEVDDAVHAKRWTLLAAVDELVWGYQAEARVIYANMKVQIFVACLILANFIVSIVEKQVWPSGQICDLKSHDCLKDTKCNCRAVTRRYKRIFTGFGAFFNYIFSVELCWNMYAHWFWLFWGDGWNVFDFITVAVGWVTEVGIELPGPLGMLRMVRALRVFRLFKRVKSLRKILESLARAVPGVANAFLIMLITMCIYAILAVDFFQAEGRDGVFHFESGATKLDAQRGLVAWANATGGATRFWVDNFDGTGLIGDVPPGARGEWLAHHEKQVDGAGTYYTPRGNEWGHEYFGTFGKSLFTLFQVLTGDSWAEAIGRPLLEGWFPMSTALFFVSFILLHSVVLINVVVAVLLEKMVTPDDEEEEEGGEAEDLLGSLDLDLPPPAPAPAPPAPAVAAPVARGAPAPAAAVDAELARVTAELAELKAAFASLEGGQAAVIAEVKKVLEDLARR